MVICERACEISSQLGAAFQASAPDPVFAVRYNLHTIDPGQDDISSKRHPSSFCWSMIFSENRYPLFGIMLLRGAATGHSRPSSRSSRRNVSGISSATGRGAVEIARASSPRDSASPETAPRSGSTERAGLHHQMTAADALLVRRRAHVTTVAAHDRAADHPIERAPSSARRHAWAPCACGEVLARSPRSYGLELPGSNHRVLDRVAADAKLDEIQGHDRSTVALSARRRKS